MKPIYETIDVAIDTSLKIATYNHSEACKLANWHIHPEHELVYIKNGKGSLRIGTEVIPYDKGVLVFLGPNIPHADFSNREYEDNLEVVVQFKSDFLEDKIAIFPEFKKIKQLIDKSKKVLLFDSSMHHQLTDTFLKFEQLDAAGKLIHFMGILDALSTTNNYRCIFETPISFSFKTLEVNRLEGVFEYVNTHYEKDISSQTLANEFGLTVNSFCRFFKKMTQRSFIQFLNNYRTRKATELFRETQLSISEVMYQCGYTDPSYFTKQFKKHQGNTPSAYILKIRSLAASEI